MCVDGWTISLLPTLRAEKGKGETNINTKYQRGGCGRLRHRANQGREGQRTTSSHSPVLQYLFAVEDRMRRRRRRR
jgi:hypothetical protein